MILGISFVFDYIDNDNLTIPFDFPVEPEQFESKDNLLELLQDAIRRSPALKQIHVSSARLTQDEQNNLPQWYIDCNGIIYERK